MEELLRLLEQKQEWLKKFLHLTQGYHAQLRDNEPAALEDIGQSNAAVIITGVYTILLQLAQAIRKFRPFF